MKVKTRVRVIITSLLLALMICLNGYATAGMQHYAKAGTTMKLANPEASPVVAPADAAEGSLEDLVNSGEPEVQHALLNCEKKEPGTKAQSGDNAASCPIQNMVRSGENSQLKAEGKDKR